MPQAKQYIAPESKDRRGILFCGLEPLALLWTTFKSVKQRYGAAFMNRIVGHEFEIRSKVSAALF